MWKKITQLVAGRDCELKERMLRSIILIGGGAVIIATVEILLVMEISAIWLPFMVLLLAAMAVSLLATFKYQKYNFASTLLGLVIVVVIMPPMFLMSGAVESGASVWLALGLLYIFVMFSGVRLYLFLILSAVVYGLTYWVSYQFPEYVIPMPSRASVYMDAYFSVIAVGLVAGIILKAHMKTFEEEHKVNIQQNEELERASDARNVFFANVSHEIRTPINAIIGLNEMIMRNNPSGETWEYAQDIQVASKMLLNQVNDILDMSQMEMNKMKIVPVQYRTEILFGELVDLIQVQTQKKQLDFILNMDKTLPAVLYGDEKRLKQILLNVLDNAVKYTEEGSVTMNVQKEEAEEGEIILKVSIADTGIGIRKEDVEYIYDSFNRVDEKKNARIMGTGLGLAISKQLLELMNGEITVDSIYTKGSTFTITIKQKVIDKTPVGEVNYRREDNGKNNIYHPGFEAPEARVLVVDDNSMNTMVVSRLLSATKVQIDVANSGEECLEMTKKKFYHVILLDYMMPGMSGTETLKAIRTQENGLCRQTAILAFSANALAGSREQYNEQGFDGYVEKPIQSKMLEAEILHFLPYEIVEYREDGGANAEEDIHIQKITMRKRKKIYITSDCTCDIPTELLEKYDIKLMYLYVKTPQGRFADTREIDSDSLTQYISAESSTAYADSVTVEEFEEFFAEALTQADRVIHIALASRCGNSYNIAVAAARGFDHVRVIDSGQISCGQGMLVLHAAKLAMDGRNAKEICDEIEKIKNHIQTRFIMPGADIFYRNGRTTAMIAKMCRTLHLHPYVEMKQKKALLVGLLGGELDNAWKQGIHLHLRRKRRIDKGVVFITHVGCSVKQLEWIKKEVLKCVPFEKVIIQKASFTSACNSGMEAIGVSYYSLK